MAFVSNTWKICIHVIENGLKYIYILDMSWNIILDMSWNIWLKWNDPSPFPSALQYNCVEMQGYSDMMNVGTWKTNYCTAERGFICEAWKGIVERKRENGSKI